MVFLILIRYNIIIKGKKYFISYLLVIVLDKKINSFKIFIIKEKLEAITKLVFLKIAKELKTYLEIAK